MKQSSNLISKPSLRHSNSIIKIYLEPKSPVIPFESHNTYNHVWAVPTVSLPVLSVSTIIPLHDLLSTQQAVKTGGMLSHTIILTLPKPPISSGMIPMGQLWFPWEHVKVYPMRPWPSLFLHVLIPSGYLTILQSQWSSSLPISPRVSCKDFKLLHWYFPISRTFFFHISKCSAILLFSSLSLAVTLSMRSTLLNVIIQNNHTLPSVFRPPSF